MTLSRNEKLKIIRQQKNENDLRISLIVPLFRNMPQFTHVQDTHGADEKGTDIVLVEKNTLGTGYRYSSVILKAVPLTNASSSKKDSDIAANVINQITLAISSGYNSPIETRKVKFSSIYIVTSQTISHSAQEMFVNHAANSNFHDIQIIKDETLVELIDEHLPEYFYYQSGQHAHLAQVFRQKLERTSGLRNLPEFRGQEKDLQEIFVSPQLRNLDTKNIKGRAKPDIRVMSSQSVFKENNHILIIGEAGSGKSIILRDIALSLLSTDTPRTSAQLPLLIKADVLDRSYSSGLSMIDSINRTICEQYEITEFSFSEQVKRTNVTLLIDGLDEIVDIDRRKILKEGLLKLSKEFQTLKVVMTSRRTQDINALDSMPTFSTWEILPFNFRQISEFLQKWFGSKEESSSRLLFALRNHALLNRLPSTPLVVTLLAILFDSSTTTEVPANLSELYRMFLDLLLGKWSLDRRIETLSDPQIREHLVKHVAHFMQFNERRSLKRSEFDSLIQKEAELRGIQISKDELFKEFTEYTSLMLVNDRDEIEFRHLSFQEFLCAELINDQQKDDEIKYIIDHFEESWWTKVLYFYCGLRKQASDTLVILEERFSEMSYQAQFVSVLEFGYLVQASYLAPIDIRMELILKTVRRFFRLLESVGELSIGRKQMPRAFVYAAFSYILSLQYSSRMLDRYYKENLEAILSREQASEEDKYLILELTLFLAQSGDFSYFSSNLRVFKQSNILMFILNVCGQILLEEVPTDEMKSSQVREFRDVLNQVRKWFRHNPRLQQRLLQVKSLPKPKPE